VQGFGIRRCIAAAAATPQAPASPDLDVRIGLLRKRVSCHSVMRALGAGAAPCRMHMPLGMAATGRRTRWQLQGTIHAENSD
jgi:hypothetical protein